MKPEYKINFGEFRNLRDFSARILIGSTLIFSAVSMPDLVEANSPASYNVHAISTGDTKIQQDVIPQVKIEDTTSKVQPEIEVYDVAPQILQRDIETKVQNKPVVKDLVSMLPCGVDLPPCSTKMGESGGDYKAFNPTGCEGRSCGGAWQFDPVTWDNYDGYKFAQDAPPEVQDAKAREIWNGGKGCSHWGACGHQ